jgi:hypothetical protein
LARNVRSRPIPAAIFRFAGTFSGAQADLNADFS